MIKLLFVLFVLTGIAQASDCVSRNHVFLIHGIGGSAKTFGVMDRYLKKTGPCIVPESFVYATRDAKLSTFDFARTFDDFSKAKLKKNAFSETDRVTLIMHSQGGLIGSIWLLRIRETNPALYKQIDSFITLSTPFYGSKIARLGKQILYSLAAENNNPISPMGKVQLNDMSYGSPTILFIEENFTRIFEGNHIRFLSLSGEKAISNKDFGEGDTTVSPYSANPNHYSYDFSKDSPVENHHMGIVPYTSVKGTHIPVLSKGIAHVGRDCLIFKDCHHQGLALIVAHLKGEDTELPARQFHKFRIHVYAKGERNNLSVIAEDEKGKQWSAKLLFHEEGFASVSFADYSSDSTPHTLKLKLYDDKILIRTEQIKYQGGFSTFVEY